MCAISRINKIRHGRRITLNSRKLLTMVLSATLITGAAVSSMPLYHAETVGSTQTDTGQKTTTDVDMPYTQNISNVLSEQMELKLQREDCDSNFDSMRSTANEQIADMEEISSHLNTQYEKYSDYGKLKKQSTGWTNSSVVRSHF